MLKLNGTNGMLASCGKYEKQQMKALRSKIIVRKRVEADLSNLFELFGIKVKGGSN